MPIAPFPPLFTSAGAVPLPVLPIDPVTGARRAANGETYFSLEQAMNRFAMDEVQLRMLYERAIELNTAAGAGDVDNEIVREAQELDLFRLEHYPELKPAEFLRLVQFCRRYKIDPRKKWVFPRRNYVPGSGVVLEFRMTVQAMRFVARTAGDVFKIGKPQFVYTDTAEGGRRLYRVLIPGYRMMADGGKHVESATAQIDEHYVEGDAWWEKMPELKLVNCAIAKLLRALFSELLDKIYIDDEGGVAEKIRSDEARRRAGLSESQMVRDDWDEHRNRPWPQTPMEFQMALMDCGLKTQRQRDAIIVQLRADVGETPREELFYKRALMRVYLDPSRYGAKAPEVEAPPGEEVG